MRAHNPWIGVLWVTGVALVLVPAIGIVWRTRQFLQPQDLAPSDPALAFVQSLVDVMVLPASIIGFATIMSVLFLHARNHAKRKRRGQPQP